MSMAIRSSQLERSDQLLQLAAIFSCKTTWVAVYVETHITIYSLEESVSHWSTRQMTQLFTYIVTHKLYSYLHLIPSVKCLRLSDASIICCGTYFQFPIQTALLRNDPVSGYFI